MRMLRYFLFIICFLGQFKIVSNSDSHFLSFIIPCYNCSKTVAQSLDSIYKQHLNMPFEIICTDDGSSDMSYEILLGYKADHPEVKIYKHDKNRGGGAARNTCVKYAKGDLIFCLDSDNILVENSVNGLIQLLDQTCCDIAVFKEIHYFQGDLLKQTHSAFYHVYKS